MKKILIIGGVLLVLCIALVAIVAVLGIGLTQPAATSGDAFMTALKNENYAAAYALCAPALQQELGGAEGLQSMIENGKVKPTQWSFSSRSVENNQGTLEGNVTFTGDRKGTVRVSLQNNGGAWQVIGFNLRES